MKHSSCHYLPAVVTYTKPAQDWAHHGWFITYDREALKASILPGVLMLLMIAGTRRVIFFGGVTTGKLHSLLGALPLTLELFFGY